MMFKDHTRATGATRHHGSTRRRRRSNPVLVAVILLGAAFVAPQAVPDASTKESTPPTSDVTPFPHPDVPDDGVSPGQLGRSAQLRSTTMAGKVFGYCSNGTVDHVPKQVRRVVVVVHGNDRVACGMANAVLAAATEEQRRTTLVVAPRFATADDRIDTREQLHWTFAGWSQGEDSANSDARVSSFEVMDQIVDRMGSRPVVLAGFSAGGQFVNRYAAASPTELHRYVIANPSSYLYLTPARPSSSSFALGLCPGYDDYRYGLKRLNRYASAAGPQMMTERYGRRRLVYLLGTADNDPRSSSMDRSCGATVQGANRLERGQTFWDYLPSVYGPSIRQRHRLELVPRIAHDAGGMFVNDQARAALFG